MSPPVTCCTACGCFFNSYQVSATTGLCPKCMTARLHAAMGTRLPPPPPPLVDEEPDLIVAAVREENYYRSIQRINVVGLVLFTIGSIWCTALAVHDFMNHNIGAAAAFSLLATTHYVQWVYTLRDMGIMRRRERRREHRGGP